MSHKNRSKIITIILSFIFILFLFYFTNRIIISKKDNEIVVKYVNKIESDLYLNLYVYDYDYNSNQYLIKELKFTKYNILYKIFYYYNDKFNYKLDLIEYENSDNNILIIKLKDDNVININDFKLMKLTYNQLKIKNIKILTNNETIVV